MACNTTREVKLCLLGTSMVGKTCLGLRYVHHRFEFNAMPTLPGAFLTKTFEKDGQRFQYNIWDTAGQERFHAMAPMYFRGAEAVIIVYDITSKSSFESVQKWVTELCKNGSEDIVIVIAGNKKDLEFERTVPTETGQSYANEIGAVFFECSALTGENVEELFTEISQKLPEKAPLQDKGFSQKNIHLVSPEKSVPKTNGAETKKNWCPCSKT